MDKALLTDHSGSSKHDISTHRKIKLSTIVPSQNIDWADILTQPHAIVTDQLTLMCVSGNVEKYYSNQDFDPSGSFIVHQQVSLSREPLQSPMPLTLSTHRYSVRSLMKPLYSEPFSSVTKCNTVGTLILNSDSVREMVVRSITNFSRRKIIPHERITST